MHDKSYDALLYDLCRLFFEGKHAAEISTELTDRYPWKITREGVYPRLREARKFLKLLPPLVDLLKDELVEEFDLVPDSVVVVDAYRELGHPIAEAGANLACDLIRDLGQARRNPVHLGFGPGSATRLLAHHLGQQLRSEPRSPDLALHAITAGCLSESAQYSPISFFSFFDQNVVKEAHGFFTDVLVPLARYPNVKKRPGYAEAFKCRDDIDIIFTGLGDTSHEHDSYRTMIETSGKRALRHLEDQGVVGNVQYRPYSAEGIINEASPASRVSTLFELEDLRDWAAKKGKHVVLLVSPCGLCGRRKTKALLPLLTVPDLKVWSSIVLDVATARELLAAKNNGAVAADNE